MTSGRPSRTGRRWSAWLALAALFVLLVGLAAGWREYRAAAFVADLQFDARLDELVGTLRAHVSNREAIAMSVAAAYHPAENGLDGRLNEVDPRLLSYAGDVYSMVWIAPVPAARRAEAERLVAVNRGEQAGFFDRQRRPVPPGRDLIVVLDIVPRSRANTSSLGLALSEFPGAAEALRRAAEIQRVAATAPLILVQLPGEKAIVFYAPVRERSGAGTVGFLGFSYRVTDLLHTLTAREAGLGAIRVTDSGVADPASALVFQSAPLAPDARVAERELGIGGRTWRIEVAVPTLAGMRCARDWGPAPSLPCCSPS